MEEDGRFDKNIMNFFNYYFVFFCEVACLLIWIGNRGEEFPIGNEERNAMALGVSWMRFDCREKLIGVGKAWKGVSHHQTTKFCSFSK